MAEEIAAKLTLDGKQPVATLDSLNDAIRTWKDEIQATTIGTKEFNELAGKIKGAETEVKKLSNSFKGIDTRAVGESFASMGRVAVGAFASMQGAMQLFGGENEEVTRQMVKAQATLSLAYGAQMIATDALKARTAALVIVQKLQAVSTSLGAAAESKSVVVRWAAVAAQKALNLVMAMNPIMAVVLAITALVVAYLAFANSASEAEKRNEALNASLDRTAKSREANLKALEDELALMAAQGVAEDKQLARRKEALEQESLDAHRDLERAKRNRKLAVEKGEDIEGALATETKAREAAAEVDKKLELAAAADRRLREGKEAKAEKERNDRSLAAANTHAEELKKLRKTLEPATDEDLELDPAIQAQIKRQEAERVLAEGHNAVMQGMLDAQLAEGQAKKDTDAQAETERIQRVAEAKVVIEQSLVSSLISLGDILATREKQMAGFAKAATLIQIGMDTAKAISSLTAGTEAAAAQGALKGGGIGGIIEGVAFYAAGIARILANIAAAKRALTSASALPSPSFGGGGGGFTGGAPPVSIPTPSTLLTSTGGIDRGGKEPIRAYVVEAEMTSKQRRVKTIEERSEIG